MKAIIFATGLFLLIIVFSCRQQTNVNSANAINESITVDAFEKKLSENDVQLIDVRTDEEFSQGHLKGAVNYDRNSGEFENLLSGLNKNKPVLVYCLSGGRSASAADLMLEMGFKEVYNMKGGMMKWNWAAKPLDDGTETISKNGMTVAEFNKLLESDKYVLVDYNAKWCEPCKKMAPVLDAFVEKQKAKLVLLKIDADKNKMLLKQMGVESLPVLELYKNNQCVWKHAGEIDEATLNSEIKL